MVDPDQAPDFHRTGPALEEFFLFAGLAANRPAYRAALTLDRLLAGCEADEDGPFAYLRGVHRAESSHASAVRTTGLGCHQQKGRFLFAAIHSGLDLRTAGLRELERLPGVGLKTSRFFVLHSRPGQRVAAIDTHIYRDLCGRYPGHPSLRKPPGSKSRYLAQEQLFLRAADLEGLEPWQLDINIWRAGRRLPAPQAVA
jgi:hypothetical protein